MAQNRKRAFEGLYAQLEETDGHAVLFSARGEPSVIFEMANPVQQLCTDSEQYLRFQDVLSNLVQTLGEGYALQKQDIFCRQAYHHDGVPDAELLPLLRGKGVHRDTHLSYYHAGGAARPVRAVRPEEVGGVPFQGGQGGGHPE